jgi:hypothetical protein
MADLGKNDIGSDVQPAKVSRNRKIDAGKASAKQA